MGDGGGSIMQYLGDKSAQSHTVGSAFQCAWTGVFVGLKENTDYDIYLKAGNKKPPAIIASISSVTHNYAILACVNWQAGIIHVSAQEVSSGDRYMHVYNFSGVMLYRFNVPVVGGKSDGWHFPHGTTTPKLSRFISSGGRKIQTIGSNGVDYGSIPLTISGGIHDAWQGYQEYDTRTEYIYFNESLSVSPRPFYLSRIKIDGTGYEIIKLLGYDIGASTLYGNWQKGNIVFRNSNLTPQYSQINTDGTGYEELPTGAGFLRNSITGGAMSRASFFDTHIVNRFNKEAGTESNKIGAHGQYTDVPIDIFL